MRIPIPLLRAITSEFLRKILGKLSLFIGGVLLVGIVLVTFLALYVNSWWTLGYVLLFPALLLGGLILVFLWIVSERLAPKGITVIEQREVRTFSNKILHMAEKSRTPVPFIALGIARDILLGKDTNFVKQMITDSTKLKSEYELLQKKLG